MESGLGYPLGEIGDYLRVYPERRTDVERTLGQLDPVRDASRVTCPVLLSAGRFDRGTCPLTFAEALAGALPNCDLRVYDGAAEGGGHVHALARTAWLADQLGYFSIATIHLVGDTFTMEQLRQNLAALAQKVASVVERL